MTDGNALRLFAEGNAGIDAGLLAIDHGEDFVQFRVTNQPVGGLAIDRPEVPFTIDDGRSDALPREAGS